MKIQYTKKRIAYIHKCPICKGNAVKGML